jgi:hypothetical protein
VPWLRRLVAGFPPLRPEFEPGSNHVGFIVDKVALRQVFFEYFGLPYLFAFHRLLHNCHIIIYHLGLEQQAKPWPQYKWTRSHPMKREREREREREIERTHTHTYIYTVTTDSI